MNHKRKSQESFAVIERSGAVTVELDRFLKSDVGKKQLKDIERLREYTASKFDDDPESFKK